MKNFRGVLAAAGLLLASILFAPTEASAACTGTAVHGGAGHACFGISPGNWGTAGTWSATSGGASCACTPTTGDDIVFDGNSGTGTYTATAISLNSLDASAAGALTLSHPASTTITITGTFFALDSAMTYTPGSSSSSLITFTSTAGTTTITTGGKNLPSVTFNGVGGTFQLQDAFSAKFGTGSIVTLTNGTLQTNGQTFSTFTFSSSNSNTRALTCGTSIVNFGGLAGNIVDFTTTTGLTVSCASATINILTATGIQAFVGGGQSYGTFNLAANLVGAYQISSSNTFANFNITAPATVRFQAGATTTITNAAAWTGSSGSEILIFSNTLASTATISFGANSTAAWSGIRDMILNAGAGTLAAANSFNFGNNTLGGGSITAPSGGGGSGHIIGG